MCWQSWGSTRVIRFSTSLLTWQVWVLVRFQFFDPFFFFFISLILVWNWNSMCFLLSLGDDKLCVCIKNWSFIDFFFLLGFLLRLKRTKPNCLLRLMWFYLAHLNWDFQVSFFGKQKQTQNTNPEIKKSCWRRRWSILRLRCSLPCFPLLLLVWEKGLCWCTIPLVESGVEDQICLRLYDTPLGSEVCVWFLRKDKKIWVLRFEFRGRKSGFEFTV